MWEYHQINMLVGQMFSAPMWEVHMHIATQLTCDSSEQMNVAQDIIFYAVIAYSHVTHLFILCEPHRKRWKLMIVSFGNMY